jgi:hypothetical protein
VNRAIDSAVDEVVNHVRKSASPYVRELQHPRRVRHHYSGSGNPYVRNYAKEPRIKTSDGPYLRHHVIHPTLTRQRTMWLMRKKKEKAARKKHSVIGKLLHDRGLQHDAEIDKEEREKGQKKHLKKHLKKTENSDQDKGKKNVHRFRKTTDSTEDEEEEEEEEEDENNPYLKKYAHPHHEFRKTENDTKKNDDLHFAKHRVVRFVTNEGEDNNLPSIIPPDAAGSFFFFSSSFFFLLFLLQGWKRTRNRMERS